jgi:hypothetical protein
MVGLTRAQNTAGEGHVMTYTADDRCSASRIQRPTARRSLYNALGRLVLDDELAAGKRCSMCTWSTASAEFSAATSAKRSGYELRNFERPMLRG